jgi:hypothetical protein
LLKCTKSALESLDQRMGLSEIVHLSWVADAKFHADSASLFRYRMRSAGRYNFWPASEQWPVFSRFAYSLEIKNRLQQNLKLLQDTLQIVCKQVLQMFYNIIN